MSHPDPTEAPEPYRRLTLLDLMGLVAASGLGAAGFLYLEITKNQAKWPSRVMDWYVLIAIQFGAVAWFVFLRGLGRLRTARREPGFLTAGGMLVGSGCSTAMLFVYLTGQSSLNIKDCWIRILRSMLGSFGFLGSAGVAAGIGAVWLTLIALGAWRPAAGTLDRLGRLLGIAYLVLAGAGYGYLLWERTIG